MQSFIRTRKSPPESTDEVIATVIAQTCDALKRRQAAEWHWVDELEADTTIPSEYIMLEHYLDEIDVDLQHKIARYLRKRQRSIGGWPLFHDGEMDLCATVKAYIALKLAGDDPDAPHMRRARG